MNINYKEEVIKDNLIFLDPDNVTHDFKHMSVQERKEYCNNNSFNFDVCLLNITGNLNIGVIIRSSHLMGVNTVHILGRPKYDKRSTVGVENYTNINIVDALKENKTEIDENIFLKLIEADKNYLPIFCETSGNKLGCFSWKEVLKKDNKNYKPLLIFGNEGRGIGQNILDLKYTQKFKYFDVRIPQQGVVNSFNVSSAASIIMWDLVNSMDWMK